MIPTIAIVDYGIGNVKSIQNALSKTGARGILSSVGHELMGADGLILPGVGAFPKGMENLRSSGLDKTIEEFRNGGKPILGICLGMQLLMEESAEFTYTKGLGLIKGGVEKLQVQHEKLPHVAWNTISFNEASRKVLGHSAGDRFYFVHSFAVVPSDKKNILATTFYDQVEFCSAVMDKNVLGVQFHPEKSGEKGLNLLRIFAQSCIPL
jgi:glutamine amidotransferase